MILKTVVGHKIAAAMTAVVFGTTAAAAATGHVPFIPDEEPVIEIEVSDEGEGGLDGSQTISSEANATPDVEEPAEVEEMAGDDGGIDAELLPPVDEGGEPYGDVPCDDAESHGEYVAGVARDASIEGNKGRVVSQAAKTTCGKDTHVAEVDGDEVEIQEVGDVEDGEVAELEEDDDADADDVENSDGSPGKSGERKNGKGPKTRD